MHKRHLRWAIVGFALALLASQFVARPGLRVFGSLDYWQNWLRYGKILRLVKAHHVDAGRLDMAEITDRSLREAVGGLDAHSEYLPPEDYRRFQMSSRREYVGVGIEVRQFGGRVIVTRVFPGGPAEEAELKAGDTIVSVNGEAVKDAPLADVVERIRGEMGTRARLGLRRPPEGERLEVAVRRESISLDTVAEVAMESEGAGYLRLRQFTSSSARELEKAVERLREQGMRGLVLDLRGNPGGRLESAVRSAELFLERGRRVVSVKRGQATKKVFEARRPQPLFRGPMIVLINGQSASAAEIFAGAMRDHGRALLVGARSFGKGSVQSVYGFDRGGGLRLTTARYLLPEGEAIDGSGVAPHVAAERSSLNAMLLLLQENHLRDMTRAEFRRAFGYAPREDSPKQLALRLLEARLAADRAGPGLEK